MTTETLDAYRSLPYKRVWEAWDEEGYRYFTVRLEEIPCVVGGGRTKDAALRAMTEAFDDYLEWRLAERLPIAAPQRVLPLEPIPRVSIRLTAVRPGTARKEPFRDSKSPRLETELRDAPLVFEARYLEPAVA